MNKKPYEILGVSTTASQDEIRNAYRALAKKYHPDLNPGKKEAEAKFQEISAAYELIGTPENRAKFDRGEFEEDFAHRDQQQTHGHRNPFYHETQSGGGRYSRSFGGIDEEILRSIFGRRGGSAGFDFSGEVPAQDVLYEMEVDFRDAVLGAEREISLPSGKRLRVKIPPGVESGTKLRFTGQGAPGKGQSAAGDAYVELTVKPSQLFKRIGNDLELEVPISLSEAVLGAEVRVPTLEGFVMVKVPPGVSSGSRLRISGKGVPGNGPRGNLQVLLRVIMAPAADAELKQALESWSKRQPFDARQGWLGSRGGES